MITAGIVAHFLKLNKVITVLAANISIPPMIPFILYGSYITGGVVLTGDLSFKLPEMSLEYIKTDLLQYIIGSCIFAVICGVIAMILSYLIMLICNRKPYHE